MRTKITRVFLALTLTSPLAACASSKFDYFEPNQPNQFSTETTISKDFNSVWDGYVASLSESFFVINNISKESRLINVSFSANSPQEYINCGRTKLTSNHPAKGTETFNYEVAADSNTWYGVDGTNHIVERKRDTSLNGRANIYIAPKDDGTTLVRANARYVLDISVVENGLTLYHHTSNNSSISFSTKETGTSSDGVKCYSKGKLEQDLLEIARSL